MCNFGVLLAKCLGISHRNFLNAPYKDKNNLKMYLDGTVNKDSEICHYCTVDTLKEIISNKCLRFSDVRFLNDSTEFIEIIPLIENVLSKKEYTADFKKTILESAEWKDLKEYRQSYVSVSRETRQCEEKKYRTYTCSFSTEQNSLSMWNYYASSGDGVSIVFDNACNMFEGSNETQLNSREELENGIIIHRGLVLYKNADKKKCIIELLNSLQEIYNEARNEIEEIRGHILYAFKESVNNMRCFFKNESFERENEYRIVLNIPEELLLSDKECKSIFKIGQFKRGNILIPFVDYNFKLESIEQITLNPYIKENDSMFKLGIEELLWQNKMKDINIICSDIPIRKYN
ncbi:MAG: DUF2971 domain-containing protein [Acutalibacteraceae bacterium]